MVFLSLLIYKSIGMIGLALVNERHFAKTLYSCLMYLSSIPSPAQNRRDSNNWGVGKKSKAQ